MKKQKIQFIVILIVLAVLIAATFGMKWYNKNKEEEKTAEEEASTIYISKVDVDTITAFSYEVDHVTYTFTKDGDTWTYDGDTSLDMDEEAIDSMLATLSSLTAIEEISDYTDLTEFGFDQPEDLISYTTSEGSVSLFVGNKNDTLNAYYIISADGGSIYLTETSLADAFSKTIEELTVTEDTESTETASARHLRRQVPPAFQCTGGSGFFPWNFHDPKHCALPRPEEPHRCHVQDPPDHQVQYADRHSLRLWHGGTGFSGPAAHFPRQPGSDQKPVNAGGSGCYLLFPLHRYQCGSSGN